MRSVIMCCVLVLASCRAPQSDVKQVAPGAMSSSGNGVAPKTVEVAKPAETGGVKVAEPPAGQPAAQPAPAKPTGSPGLNFMPGYGAEVEGVLVENIRPGGAADKAGLVSGDVIVKFGGIAVANVEEYTAALGTVQPGDKVEIVFKRGSETKTIKAEVGVSSR